MKGKLLIMPLTHKQLSKFTWGELSKSKLTYADLSSGTLEILAILKEKEDVPPEVYEKFKQLFEDFKKDNPEIARDLEVPTSYNKKSIAEIISHLIGLAGSALTIADYAYKFFKK